MPRVGRDPRPEVVGAVDEGPPCAPVDVGGWVVDGGGVVVVGCSGVVVYTGGSYCVVGCWVLVGTGGGAACEVVGLTGVVESGGLPLSSTHAAMAPRMSAPMPNPASAF